MSDNDQEEIENRCYLGWQVTKVIQHCDWLKLGSYKTAPTRGLVSAAT